MKTILKNVLSVCLLVSIIAGMSGCVERRYYHEHHVHSPEYVQRHHVAVEIHN